MNVNWKIDMGCSYQELPSSFFHSSSRVSISWLLEDLVRDSIVPDDWVVAMVSESMYFTVVLRLVTVGSGDQYL